jgi:hypothetical protein
VYNSLMTARLVAADTKDHCMSSLDMYGIIKVSFSVNIDVGGLVIWCALVFVSLCQVVAYIKSGLGCRLATSMMCATAVVSKGGC